MAAFTRVNPGDPMQAHQLNQVIDALDGAVGAGVPIAVTAVNDASNYAVAIQNDDATNSRALLVLKQDGTNLITADKNGVVLALANGSVPNVALGSDTARANLLTNGGFEIWQRGNGPFTGLSLFSADRWQATGVPGDTISISRDTTNVDTGSGACAAVTFTKGSGQTGMVNTFGVDGASLVGRSLSASIRVRTATANAVRIGIYNGSAWTYSSYHTGGGVYQTLTVSGVTVASNNVQPGVWFDATCTAYVDNAMLVVGSQPADYAPLHPADDLARCLRYYERFAPAGGDNLVGVGQAVSATTVGVPFSYKAIKPVLPTITLSAAGTFYVTGASGGSTGACTGINSDMAGLGSCRIIPVGTGLVAGNASHLFASTGTATVSVEANP